MIAAAANPAAPRRRGFCLRVAWASRPSGSCGTGFQPVFPKVTQSAQRTAEDSETIKTPCTHSQPTPFSQTHYYPQMTQMNTDTNQPAFHLCPSV